MENCIISLIGNLKKKKNDCILKCEYLLSAIAQTEFSETQLFLQTLYVKWIFRSACTSAQSDQSSPHALEDLLLLRPENTDW